MVRLTDCPDMTVAVYHGRKATTQQQQKQLSQKDWSDIMSRAKFLNEHANFVCPYQSGFLHLGHDTVYNLSSNNNQSL